MIKLLLLLDHTERACLCSRYMFTSFPQAFLHFMQPACLVAAGCYVDFAGWYLSGTVLLINTLLLMVIVNWAAPSLLCPIFFQAASVQERATDDSMCLHQNHCQEESLCNCGVSLVQEGYTRSCSSASAAGSEGTCTVTTVWLKCGYVIELIHTPP